MNRSEHVLAGLGTSDKAPFTPVQVQKLFFLLDRNGGGEFFGQPQFNFQPYDFGPFDKDVYTELESLSEEGLVEISYSSAGLKNYRLTAVGQQRSEEVLAKLDARSRQFVANVAEWIRRQSFTGLLSTIYSLYPDMAEKSVFRRT